MTAIKNVRHLVMLQGAALVIFAAQAVHASNVGVDVNINLGSPPVRVVVPEPVYIPRPEPVYIPQPEPVVIGGDLQFIYPDDLGFYVAVGVPYDLFYLRNSYFIFRDGRWLRARSSRGPWVEQRYRDLPPTLRRHRLERIREYRDREYGFYRRDRDHYRGRQFRPDRGEWREHKREMKAQREEQHRYEKEQRREEKRYEKEQRREEKRFDKEERREHRGGRD